VSSCSRFLLILFISGGLAVLVWTMIAYNGQSDCLPLAISYGMLLSIPGNIVSKITFGIQGVVMLTTATSQHRQLPACTLFHLFQSLLHTKIALMSIMSNLSPSVVVVNMSR